MKKWTGKLWGMLLVLSLVITLLPVGAWAQEAEVLIRVLPSVSQAEVGDVVTYTVTAEAADLLALEFKLHLPEGLSYVPNSGSVPEDLAESIGWASADWTEETKKWTCYYDVGVEVPADTVILTFQALVEAPGTYRVELANLLPYNGDYRDASFLTQLGTLTVAAPRPAMVTGLKATNVQETGFTLTWDAVESVKKYYVYLNGMIYKSTTENTMTVNNREEGTSYDVQVIAMFEGYLQSLENAQVLTVTTLVPQHPDKISGLKVKDIQETSFTLIWDAPEGATKYFIYLNGAAYYSSTEATVTATRRKAGTSYNVQVIAVFADGTMQSVGNAPVLTVKTLEKQATAPAFTVTPQESSVAIKWDTTDVTKTWIYMGTSEAELKPVHSTTDGSFTITGLDSDTTYYFRLAHIIGGKLLNSENILTAKPLAPKHPAQVSGLKVTDLQETSFTLTWDAPEGATKYFIYLNGAAYYSSTEATVTATRRKAGTSYNVQVIAVFDDGAMQSVENATVLKVKTPEKQITAPAFTVTPGEGSVALAWDATGVTKTWIYMGTSEADLKPVHSTTDGSFTVTGLTAGKTYYFRLSHIIDGKLVTSEQILKVTL